MKVKLLFVDDEPFWARSYIQELEKDFEVDYATKAEQAVRMFKEGRPYQAVVLDIMMAAPSGAEKATAEGLDTGLWILNQIRTPLKSRATPVIVLTNRSLLHISEALNAMGFPAGQVRAQSKVETPAFLLPKIVAAAIASSEKPGTAHSKHKVPRPQKQTKPATRSDDVPRSFLAVATEWDSRHGGLSTFNRELCIALAARGHKVFCYVPTASADEIARAAEHGVSLLLPPAIPESGGPSALLQKPSLPSGTKVEFIIGHDRQTGPFAKALASTHFKGCKRLHFIHTAPGEIEWYKPVPAEQTASQKMEVRQQEQIQLSAGAELVVAVGPRLHREIGQLLHTSTPTARILNFTPGIRPERRVAGFRIPPAIQCLVMGRAEDAELKGLDLAARAMGLVQERHRVKPEPELIVRGAPAGTADDLRRLLLRTAQRPDLRVAAKHYASSVETLKDDLLKASLVLMPSKVEGFGLVALEAISLSVPVLVSERSGLAELLTSLCPEMSHLSVVPVTTELEADALEWSRQIEFNLLDREAAYRRAARLREILIPQLDWTAATKELVAAVDGAK